MRKNSMKSTRKFNEENERIKRSYLRYLRNAKGLSENSVNKASDAILRLEKATDFKPFFKLNGDDVLQFKEDLSKSATGKTGKPMVAASRVNIQACVRSFMHWLADQTGYKSKITHSFAGHFSPQQKDMRIAKASRIKPTATIEQADHTFRLMPSKTVLDRRNRAFFALMMLTAARIEAAASLKIGHVDLNLGCVHQDGAVVLTKFGKTFTTYFMPVSQMYEECLSEWIEELTKVHLFGPSDPLFPKPDIFISPSDGIVNRGLSRLHYKTNDCLRRVIKDAFLAVGLPPYPPHRFRNIAVATSNGYVTTAEELKAISMNLGHSSIKTTVDDYGAISPERQGEVMRRLREKVRSKQ
jgi:integrase/recombinase XerD